MIQESVLINNSIEETRQIVKKLIQSLGKITFEEPNRIGWTTGFGLQTIECETHLILHDNKTEITTYTRTDDIWQTGAKKTIKKFYTSLFKNSKIKLIEEPTKTIPIEPKSNFKWEYVIGVIFIIIFIIGALDLYPNNEVDTYITQSGYYGTYSKEDLKKVMTYMIQKDKTLLDQFYNSGRLFEIPSNKEAYVIESNLTTVKIRIKGNSEEIWTVNEAIKSE